MEELKQNQENAEKNLEPKSGNNKNLIFAMAVIIIFLTVFIIVKNWMADIYSDNPRSTNNASATQPAVNDSINNSNGLSQINGDPNTGVEITAIYEKEKTQNQTVFQIQFNTHVIDYSNYNFQENIILRDAQNKEYKATSVAKQGGGHHQSIEIIFPVVASPFKLVIKNLAGVPERIFDF